jgi:Tol biopolymer transport system component
VKARFLVLGIVLVCVLAIVGQIAKAAPPTQQQRQDRYPTWGPDGETLAFVTRTGANGRISLIGANGRALRSLTPSQPAPWGLRWSPDGTALAYVSADHLWRVDVATRKLTQLTGVLADDMQPEWSPDGREIAFTRFESCFRCTTIYAMPAAGGQPRVLVPNSTTRHAVWSPDGTQFVDSTGSIRSSVDGAFLGRVGFGSSYDWSNRGIAWVSGGFVYAGAPGTDVSRRVGGDAHATATVARWSRSGQRIAFGLDGWLAVATTNVASWHRVVRASVANDAPTWAPNGTIAYVEPSRCGIDTILADRTHHRRLTHVC